MKYTKEILQFLLCIVFVGCFVYFLSRSTFVEGFQTQTSFLSFESSLPSITLEDFQKEVFISDEEQNTTVLPILQNAQVNFLKNTFRNITSASVAISFLSRDQRYSNHLNNIPASSTSEEVFLYLSNVPQIQELWKSYIPFENYLKDSLKQLPSDTIKIILFLLRNERFRKMYSDTNLKIQNSFMISFLLNLPWSRPPIKYTDEFINTSIVQNKGISPDKIHFGQQILFIYFADYPNNLTMNPHSFRALPFLTQQNEQRTDRSNILSAVSSTDVSKFEPINQFEVNQMIDQIQNNLNISKFPKYLQNLPVALEPQKKDISATAQVQALLELQKNSPEIFDIKKNDIFQAKQVQSIILVQLKLSDDFIYTITDFIFTQANSAMSIQFDVFIPQYFKNPYKSFDFLFRYFQDNSSKSYSWNPRDPNNLNQFLYSQHVKFILGPNDSWNRAIVLPSDINQHPLTSDPSSLYPFKSLVEKALLANPADFQKIQLQIYNYLSQRGFANRQFYQGVERVLHQNEIYKLIEIKDKTQLSFFIENTLLPSQNEIQLRQNNISLDNLNISKSDLNENIKNMVTSEIQKDTPSSTLKSDPDRFFLFITTNPGFSKLLTIVAYTLNSESMKQGRFKSVTNSVKNDISSLRSQYQDLSGIQQDIMKMKNYSIAKQKEFENRCISNLDESCKNLADADLPLYDSIDIGDSANEVMITRGMDLDQQLSNLDEQGKMFRMQIIDLSGFDATSDIGYLEVDKVRDELNQLSPYYISPDAIERIVNLLVGTAKKDRRLINASNSLRNSQQTLLSIRSILGI